MGRAARGLRVDGEITRTRILETAGRLFATAGYAETTGKVIAARAGVDQASINYHFGSRNGLYEAVLREAHGRLIKLADLQQLAGSPLPAVAKLRVLIDQLVARAQGGTDGWHLQVLARELMAPSSHLRALFRTELLPKLSAVRSILSGITSIPADDPALTRSLLNVVAPFLMLFIGGRSSMPGPVQEILRMPHQQIVEHLHGFALAGLKGVARGYRRRGRR